ncbi:hypothetical protein UPYG_G00001710 [Umbra pygmaea]|uniref:Cryptochrome/DNA photolyase FAD-binding domain-containing protein n=1 Tax=Umbra pygmaea TaxID=75934 RepID=A0ABD0XJT1_UMBPY
MSPCASRRYLPILRGFPAKYIYDPWNAPESVQAAAKCVIGVHYPKPMVNHAESSRLNIERMKQIHQQLSRYRGLGLLASVPSTNGSGGIMTYSHGEQQMRMNNPAHLSGGAVASGSVLMNYDSEEYPGPIRVQQQQKHVDFIREEGPLLLSMGSVTGKRGRESEQEPGGDNHHVTSHKIHRQTAGFGVQEIVLTRTTPLNALKQLPCDWLSRSLH